ncbi:MAG: GNAT family N-acetyltransferase [Candidatus Pacearchaeota archaeon]
MKNKIELRKFRMSDIDRVMEIFPDRKVTDPAGLTLSSHPPKITKKFEMKWLRGTLIENKKKNPKKYNRTIILNGELIGSIGLQNINYKDENAEVGYWIGTDYWGKDYTTEALKLFLKEVDKKFNFKRIYGYAFTFNPASKKVMEKCGFKLEGIRKAIKKGKNKFYDDWQLARVK